MRKNLPQLHPVTIHYKQSNVLFGAGQMKWRWFQHRMHSLIEGTFPLSLINDPIYKSPIGNFSINFCTLRLCYRRWDVWVEWAGNDLGRFSHHLVTVFSAWHVESYPYQRSDVAWSLVLVDDAVRGSISSGSFAGYWMMWNLIPWWEIEAWVKMNLSISLVVIDWQGPITLSACILWL